MKNKKIICTLLLIFCISLIFGFSNQNGSTSECLSDKVSVSIIDITSKVLKKEINLERKEELVEKMRKLIRKTAHFTIYLILGIITYFTLKSYGVKKYILTSILFCFIYACLDEFHQVFISGRNGSAIDVLIDISGAILGIYLISFFKKFLLKTNNIS